MENGIKSLDITYRCNICSRETTNSMDDAVAHMLNHGASALVPTRLLITGQKDVKPITTNTTIAPVDVQTQQAAAKEVSIAQSDRSAQVPGAPIAQVQKVPSPILS
jgi:hypothetical protein